MVVHIYLVMRYRLMLPFEVQKGLDIIQRDNPITLIKDHPFRSADPRIFKEGRGEVKSSRNGKFQWAYVPAKRMKRSFTISLEGLDRHFGGQVMPRPLEIFAPGSFRIIVHVCTNQLIDQLIGTYYATFSA